MDRELKAQLSSFTYQDRPISGTAVCAVNDFHRFLNDRGVLENRLTLITVNNPESVAGSLDISSIALKGAPLDTWIARSQSVFLGTRGIHVPAGFINRLREPLVVSYLLDSGLCVAKISTLGRDEYILVTKSPFIVSMYQSDLTPADRKKGFNRFATQFATSYEELSKCSFNTVRLFSDIDGVRLSPKILSARSSRHLLPFYVVQNYAAQLVGLLSSRKVRLIYRDHENVDVSLVTTLVNEVVADWLGTTLTGAELAKWADWCNGSSLGYLSLPDLSHSGQFVSVPLLGIQAVTLC